MQRLVRRYPRSGGAAFAGQDLHASVQGKAAHLLYFVVKDHPFSDGN